MATSTPTAQGLLTAGYATARARISGAGFTIFHFMGQPIAFCNEVQHTSPQLVAQPVPIQPMDEPYPVEIMVSPAAGPGQLVLNLFELFGSNGKASKIWDRLGTKVNNYASTPSIYLNNDPTTGNLNQGKFTGAVDIVDIVLRQAQIEPSNMQITKIIRPLSNSGASKGHYTEEYHGCVITDIVDGEQVSVGSMQVIKQITVAYRFLTRDGTPSAAYAFRNNNLKRLVSNAQVV